LATRRLEPGHGLPVPTVSQEKPMERTSVRAFAWYILPLQL
jgi:hypothetical protein